MKSYEERLEDRISDLRTLYALLVSFLVITLLVGLNTFCEEWEETIEILNNQSTTKPVSFSNVSALDLDCTIRIEQAEQGKRRN